MFSVKASVVIISLLITGCTSLDKEHRVDCHAECEECKKVTLRCTGDRNIETKEVTVNG